MYNFENVKNLYEDGYRCIYYDTSINNPYVYLKNFENENSKEIQFENEEEFIKFKNYINTLNEIRN